MSRKRHITLLPTNYLCMLDHFVGLSLNVLITFPWHGLALIVSEIFENIVYRLRKVMTALQFYNYPG